MVLAMKKLIAQVEALPEREQTELAELMLTELKRRASGTQAKNSEGVRPEVEAAFDDIASRHFDALGKLA